MKTKYVGWVILGVVAISMSGCAAGGVTSDPSSTPSASPSATEEFTGVSAWQPAMDACATYDKFVSSVKLGEKTLAVNIASLGGDNFDSDFYDNIKCVLNFHGSAIGNVFGSTDAYVNEDVTFSGEGTNGEVVEGTFNFVTGKALFELK